MSNAARRTSARPGTQAARRGAVEVDDRCHATVVHLEAVRTARRALPPAGLVARSADLLALLANRTRLNILLSLRARGADQPELCVCDLAVVCRASQSMISHQLRLLRTGGLVTQRREGKLAYYRLTSRAITALLRSALALEGMSE